MCSSTVSIPQDHLFLAWDLIGYSAEQLDYAYFLWLRGISVYVQQTSLFGYEHLILKHLYNKKKKTCLLLCFFQWSGRLGFLLAVPQKPTGVSRASHWLLWGLEKDLTGNTFHLRSTEIFLFFFKFFFLKIILFKAAVCLWGGLVWGFFQRL